MDGSDKKLQNLKAEIAKKKAKKMAPGATRGDWKTGTMPDVDPTNPKGMREKFGYDLFLRKGRKIDVKGKG